MEQFKQAYAELNAAQKEAVDATQGPLLVIAGPGTGKTQLLSVRVANILDKDDVLPENILCLTFTNKAASNMQLRLSRLAGPAAQKVMIKTFHSFAAEVMNLYPEYFWNGAALTNVPDALQLEIITGLLSTLPLDNPLALKFAGKFTSTGSVMEALKLSKEAGLTPDKLRGLIELNIAYINTIEDELVDICAERVNYKKLDELAMRVGQLPEQETDELTRPLLALSTVLLESFEEAHSQDEGTGKAANVSAWKRRWITSIDGKKGMFEERKRNDWWLALADVYEGYRNRLHESGYYDYADMIIEVITQLEQNPDMRADIQERFQYVLIDEFQDTNAAQLRLAHLVADHFSQEGNPNIMAVGDDDQSIYKFNGAELSNMLGFTRTYPKAKVVVLTDNYRSSSDILEFSAHVIKQASERVVTRNPNLSKELTAKNPPAGKSTINHTSYPTREHQYYALAEEIAELKKNGTVAVLARSHESLRAVAHALNQQAIPVRYEQQQNVLEQPVIKQLAFVCKIITALQEGNEFNLNAYLPRMLAHEAWGIPPLTLWHLALKNRVKPHWIDSMLESKDERLEIISHWLLWLASAASSEPLPRMLEFIIGLSASEHMTSPLRRYYLEADDIDTPYLANISAVHKLIGLAQDFSAQGEATVGDFVRLLHVTSDNQRVITDESLFVTAPDAVELLTVYKAKGLEFDAVVIVDAMESIWKPSSKGRKPPSNLPLRPSGDNYDDYVRLMFVAVTRAKRDVLISSFYTTAAGEPAVPSSIIRDILPAKEITMEDAGKPAEVLESALSWPRLEGSEEKELLRDILSEYSLSPSAYLDFLDIAKGGPHYFLQKYLLRLPEAQSALAAFGNAIHSALERAQQLSSDKKFTLSAVLSAYEEALISQGLGSTEYARYLPHGEKVLERLFQDYNVRLTETGRPEVKLTLTISDAPISGKLDRLDESQDSGEVLITDYKTSTPLSSLHTKAKTGRIKAWRHRTQLEFYVLMAMRSGVYKNAAGFQAQMMYVEAESVKDLTRSLAPSAEQLERMEKLIGIVWQKIISLNLPDVRHYSEDYDGILAFEEDLLAGKI